MTTSIRIERVPNGQISEHDDDVLGRISAESFTQPWAVPVVQWSDVEQHFFVRDAQGEIVSSLGVLRRNVIVGGKHEVHVGGIGGVMTAVAARRRGYAGMLLRATADYIRDEWGLKFGLIQAANHNLHFYEQLGWRQAHVPMWFDQPGGVRRTSPENAMVLTLGDAVWPEGEIDMNGWPW
jgi:GNAT superfamily N-acetyltransferase